jgi:hypothetical protein
MSTPKVIQDALRAAIAAEGDAHVSRRLGLSRQTVARLVAGLPVQRGSVVQAAHGLGLPLPNVAPLAIAHHPTTRA